MSRKHHLLLTLFAFLSATNTAFSQDRSGGFFDKDFVKSGTSASSATTNPNGFYSGSSGQITPRSPAMPPPTVQVPSARETKKTEAELEKAVGAAQRASKASATQQVDSTKDGVGTFGFDSKADAPSTTAPTGAVVSEPQAQQVQGIMEKLQAIQADGAASGATLESDYYRKLMEQVRQSAGMPKEQAAPGDPFRSVGTQVEKATSSSGQSISVPGSAVDSRTPGVAGDATLSLYVAASPPDHLKRHVEQLFAVHNRYHVSLKSLVIVGASENQNIVPTPVLQLMGSAVVAKLNKRGTFDEQVRKLKNTVDNIPRHRRDGEFKIADMSGEQFSADLGLSIQQKATPPEQLSGKTSPLWAVEQGGQLYYFEGIDPFRLFSAQGVFIGKEQQLTAQPTRIQFKGSKKSELSSLSVNKNEVVQEVDRSFRELKRNLENIGQLPGLPPCTVARTRSSSTAGGQLPENIDIVYYNAHDVQQQSLVEKWPGKAVPYTVENAHDYQSPGTPRPATDQKTGPSKAQGPALVGLMLGIECLPTRIVFSSSNSQSTIEYREGGNAWSMP